jgi:hypothetical protein
LPGLDVTAVAAAAELGRSAWEAFVSDTLISLVPQDRNFVPKEVSRERAVSLLRAFAPAADEVCETLSEEVEFIDCGGNWSGVQCPACGMDAEPWFGDEMSRCYEQSHFRDLRAIAPCCGSVVFLDALNFGWPVGFARFVLDARNPRLGSTELPREQHQALEEALGCPLRVIWRHY